MWLKYKYSWQLDQRGVRPGSLTVSRAGPESRRHLPAPRAEDWRARLECPLTNPA